MLYKNEKGGRIMVRISLPQTKEECELSSLYSALCDSYLNAAKGYINQNNVSSSFFFDVSYTVEQQGKNGVKIKRQCVLKESTRTIKTKIFTDFFLSADLSLKR